MRSDRFFVSSVFVLLTASALPGLAAKPAQPARGIEEGAGEEASPVQSGRFAARLNDLWVTAHAKARLLRSEEVPGGAVDVDARDGVVTLFGMVPTPSAQAAAELELAKLEGVHRVDNRLEVVPEPAQEATQRHDRALEQRVRERLEARRPEIAELDVAICNSVARLRGSVENDAEHRAVLEIARTAGVRDVLDQLQIDGRPAAS